MITRKINCQIIKFFFVNDVESNVEKETHFEVFQLEEIRRNILMILL